MPWLVIQALRFLSGSTDNEDLVSLYVLSECDANYQTVESTRELAKTMTSLETIMLCRHDKYYLPAVHVSRDIEIA